MNQENKNIAKREQEKPGSTNSLTQERATESNAIQIPEISLPKGGGALKSIDEKFEINAANGTAGFSIPLPVTPGRNSFSPSLSLSYNSGGGNSPYGLGWSVGYPMIQRKTDKRLPRYRDGLEEDTFMFSGAEDLVPFLEEDGSLMENVENGYTIKRYRPRIEGGFARIEKIHHANHGVYWKVTTRENIATIFGRSPNARIANPEDESQIFQWMPEFSYDDKGNWIKYAYKREDLSNVPHELFEKNRINGVAPFTNTYLKSIKYGNRIAYYADPTKPYDPPPPADEEHFFELVLDYGEHGEELQPHHENAKWLYRADAFSSYRSGFEIRTNRLCRRILLFHHFNDPSIKQWDGSLFGDDYLVRSLELKYEPSAINDSGQSETTYLKSITQSGYIRMADGTYSKKSLPPLIFSYEKLNWNKTIKTVSPENIVNAPVGLTNNYQWVDLYGEGLSGILAEQGEGWYYKSNLGDANEDGNVTFTIAKKVIPKPSFTGLASGVLSIQDLAANGEKQVVVNSGDLKGYFELGEEWKPFRPFEQIANIDLRDPNTRLIDLNGDGQPELVITEEKVFTWYAADGKRGHLPAEQTLKSFNEERGPALVFADPLQTIFLADMSGDGLTDIVRIRNGEICYWANQGYGKFSAKVSMGNAPRFDHPDHFNPQYLHLADVSGTGATDVIYLGKNTFKAFINLSGNAWSDAHEIEPFFPIDNNCRLSVIDLLGTGTSCIVWSSDLPAYANAPMRYIDLMNSKKPHVLIHYKNNFGKETSIQYKSSAHYYLKDKLEGKPWITKLPFPVQVVSKLVVEEKITDVRFTSEYKYHHGYYDHAEREFRGFGMVEQVSTETYEEWSVNNAGNRLETAYELYQPPTLTKTWFHTGAFLEKEKLEAQFEKEHWYHEYSRHFEELAITEPNLPPNHLATAIQHLSGDEYREAWRACKGMTLRQEVFALDADKKIREEQQRNTYSDNDPDFSAFQNEARKTELKPYSVATHNCYLQMLQPRVGNKFGVFQATESEVLTITYERNEKDPRIAHQIHTKIDELGNILESAAVVYPRKNTDQLDQFIARIEPLEYQRVKEKQSAVESLKNLKAQQAQTHIIYTQQQFTNDITEKATYRLRQACEVKTFEITGLSPTGALFHQADLERVLSTDFVEIAYHEEPDNGRKQRRLLEQVRTLFYNDELSAPLPLHQLAPHGITYESYQLAYTPELLATLFGDKITDTQTLLATQGKYVHQEDENWWIRSGQPVFLRSGETIDRARTRFYSPLSYRSPFGAETKIEYFQDFYLLLQASEDELGNRAEVAQFNFRTLAPVRMKDINDNLSEILVDELGLVKALALLGKGNEADSLEGLTEYTTAAEEERTSAYFSLTDSDALEDAAKHLLQRASTRFVYNFNRYLRSEELRREQMADNAPPAPCEQIKLMPTVAGSITRELHSAAAIDSPVQLAFEYSDGMGNIAMTKIQAEGGDALQLQIEADCRFSVATVSTGDKRRWLGNGRTILNNKGKPVKQYEPYFSVTPFYEDNKELVERGVTPIIYYDAVGRAVRTELPDGTFTSIAFDSWHQLHYDASDTVQDSRWYQDRIHRRIDEQLRDAGRDPQKEQEAARKAAWHHNTPGILHLDNLGRPVLSFAHNRVHTYDPREASTITGVQEEWYSTAIDLDLEGNARRITDARGNTLMQYAYDMLGHRVYQRSMDAGEKWSFNNIAGNPVQAWDSKGQSFISGYDRLQRPETLHLSKDGRTYLISRTIYGESRPDPKARNLRGQVYQLYDSSGSMTQVQFDFKGNLLEARRQLAAADPAPIIDWSDGAPDHHLAPETFTKITEYDALNRMARLYNWHHTAGRVAVYEPVYNQRGLLAAEDLITSATKTGDGYSGGRRVPAVSRIEYNEKGQRTRMRYGNGTHTRYTYDSRTFRLLRLRTTRSDTASFAGLPASFKDPAIVQDLHYTYDPVGNITEIADEVFQPIFYRNKKVEARNRYTYDALSRLLAATGRENAAFRNAPQAVEPVPVTENTPQTDKALRNYTQTYQYDAVGNILQMRHSAEGGSWTRHYQYARDSNRLLATEVGSSLVYELYSDRPTLEIRYDYDAHGNMLNYHNTAAPYRPDWDYLDRVHHLHLGGGGEAYYQYDGQRERSRKRVEKNGLTEERLYLGGMEVYRRWKNNQLIAEIETYHLFVDDQRILLYEEVVTPPPSSGPGGGRYQYSNHLGSVGLEMDAHAQIISYEEYHPYGTVAFQATNKAVQATAKRYRYTGMERDEESGLNYHSARYYLPWLGRWLSTDPIGVEGGGNLYSYAANCPIMKTDIKGKQPVITEPLENAHMSRDVYSGHGGRDLVGDWERATQDEIDTLGLHDAIFEHPASGFRAGLYTHRDENGTVRYTLAFAGTDPDARDVSTDISSAIGTGSTQYDLALLLGERVVEAVGRENLTVTGHSLGGGLASAVSFNSQVKAYVFNAQGVNPNNLSDYYMIHDHMDAASAQARANSNINNPNNNERILSFFAQYEILSIFQDIVFRNFLPESILSFPTDQLAASQGTRIMLPQNEIDQLLTRLISNLQYSPANVLGLQVSAMHDGMGIVLLPVPENIELINQISSRAIESHSIDTVISLLTRFNVPPSHPRFTPSLRHGPVPIPN